MLRQYWNRVAILGGSLALLAVGATPALADTNPCPAGTNPYFSAPSIYLGEEPGSTIWSSRVSFFTYCATPTNSTDTSHPLANVTVTDVSITSILFNDLVGSADGANPTTALPLGQAVKLKIASAGFPNGIVTDGTGQATFLLRVQSAGSPSLALPDGGTRLVGFHLDYSSGMGNVMPETVPTGVGMVYAATPELDSLALFGSGALGLAGYAMLRMRARRRRN